MPEKNRYEENNRNKETNPDHGAQRIDKSPGEEPSRDYENVVADTQKAKDKNDGDPSKPEDQPKSE